MGEGNLPVGVLGASGYAGVQLVRLVHQHPRLSLAFVGEEVEGEEESGAGHGEPQHGEPPDREPPDREPRLQGKRFVDVHPHLRPVNLPIESLDLEAIARRCRVVFLALPHGVSHRWVPGLLERGVRVIDLSADYRFADLSVYDSWYGASGADRVGGAGGRSDGAIAARAVYGLPELNRRSLVDAQVVGCPGCYATASLLALAPLLRQGLIDLDNIVIDAKCGTSGEGRSAKLSMLFAEVDNSVVVYGVANHRHTPEIEQVCRDLSGKEVLVQFTPHQIPMVRGLLATVYARLRDPGLVREDLLTIYKAVYQHSPWVTTLGAGIYPQTKWVWGTNHCYLGLEVDRRTGRVIVFSAIDNLMKGQAGQALQCLNVMMGWEETLGLPDLCFYP